MLQRNASIKKECFPPAQFNEFAAVKQANLVKRSLTNCGVKRTRIRVIGVNFSDFLIKGKEI